MHNFCCLCLSLSGWISYFACLLPDLFHSHSESAVPKSVDHPELLDRFGSYVEERLVNIHHGLDMTHQDPTFTSFHGTALSDVEPVSEGSIRMHISQRLIRSFEEVQRGRLCQDPAGNRTTQRPPDHRKETQTAVVWSCLLFIRPGQNHLARHSERGKKTRQTEKEVGRQHQGMDRPGVCQVTEGSGEQGRMEETGCEIICGDPTTFTVRG